MITKEVGNSGTPIVSGVYENEYLTALQGTNAHIIYNRMRRSDPQVRKVLAAVVNPIKAAKWFIEPVSTDEADVKIASLLEQIFFKDINFAAKLGEILTFLPHGYSMFEVIHENKQSPEMGAYTGIANLAFRNQTTIDKWEHDKKSGKLLKVHQFSNGDIESDVWLDADSLLIFFNEKEGDDNGFPILRPLYGPYKRKNLTETLKMVGIERSAIPTPTLEVPETISPNDKEYKAAIALLENFTSAENSYITYPKGWVLDLHQNSGFDPMKLEDSIKREDEKMAGAILATFLELGTGGNGGAYALGENLERFFSMVIESFANNIADTINAEIIPSLIRMNLGEGAMLFPKLQFSGITDKAGKEFMETLTGYTNAGIIQKDEPLEDYVRKVHNYPKKADGEMLENQEADNANQDNKDDNKDDSNNSDDNNADNSKVQDDNNSDNVNLSNLDDDAIILAENPRKEISNQAKTTTELMRSNLQFIGEKLVRDIIKKYKSLPENNKLKAIDNIKLGGTAKYKRQLKGALNVTAKKAFDRVKTEVPTKKEVKLKDDIEFFNALDDFGTIKFVESEFSTLPKHVQKLIALQSTRIVDRQANELEDRVAFTFMGVEQTTNDYKVIEKDLNKAAASYVEGGTIQTAGVNVTSSLVNQTRNEYFFAPDVLDEIYAFRFSNQDPQSAICKKLTGKVFAKDDQEFLQYSPPLHHNCKSYLSTVLNSQKSKPTIEPLPPITKEDRKSITLNEKIENLLNVFDNEKEEN